jgi:SnoaL-like domain
MDYPASPVGQRDHRHRPDGRGTGLQTWHYFFVSAREHADRWLSAWNDRDLDGIVACYSEDVDFVAPTVVGRWDRPDGALRGRQELRQHFARGLELAPEIHFSEEALLQTPGGYALLYVRENGNRVLDVVELDSDDLASRVRAYYESDQA